METLQSYLAGKRKADFAAQIKTTPSYLSQMLSGHRKPSLAMMLKIESATGGAVDLNSWSPSSSAPSGSN